MPVKNESSYIKEALFSVAELGQGGYEVVVVDDGSTDNTVEIIESLGLNFVRLVRTAGVGKATAFSIAYEHASGDRFILLAGDDRLVASVVEARLAVLDAVAPDQPAISFCKLHSFSDKSAYHGMILPRRPDKGLESGGCMAFNKAFGDMAFPIPFMLANEDSWLMLHARYSKVVVCHVPSVGLMYRIHEHNSYKRGVDYSKVNEQMWLRQRALFYFYEKYRATLTGEQQREILVEFCLQLLRYLGYPMFILLLPRSDLKKRVKFFFNSNSFMYSLRERFYKFFSGR